MSYWLTLAGVLMLGYTLIKWSERVNEQDQNRFYSSANASATELDIRPVALASHTGEAGNGGENEGNYGGEE
jgi:hypothetical protein